MSGNVKNKLNVRIKIATPSLSKTYYALWDWNLFLVNSSSDLVSSSADDFEDALFVFLSLSEHHMVISSEDVISKALQSLRYHQETDYPAFM